MIAMQLACLAKQLFLEDLRRVQELDAVGTNLGQGSKVPVPNRRLVPGSKEKRGKTGKNGGKRATRRKTGENGKKTGENRGNLGGGVFWTRPTHPTFDPPLPCYNSVMSIFCKPN